MTVAEEKGEREGREKGERLEREGREKGEREREGRERERPTNDREAGSRGLYRGTSTRDCSHTEVGARVLRAH